VVTPGSFTHVDTMWEDPAAALMFRRLASFARLIRFDRVGTGASDPAPLDHLPPWESYAEQLAAVLDEVGSDSAAILVSLDAGSMAMYFAATKPERTSALILFNTTARVLAADDYPIGISREVAEALLGQFDKVWGTEAMAQLAAPSRADDERFRRWIAKAARSAASPRAAQAFLRVMFEIDARPLLPLIHAPTLVLHRTGYPILPIEHARFLAEQIPDAKLIELPGADATLPHQAADVVLDHVEAFLRNLRRPAAPDRVLATVLFTDIVPPPSRPAGWGTGAGGSCWRSTTSWPAGWSRSSLASWSRPPAMGSWPPSMVPAGGSAARPRFEMSLVGSACRSGRGCTPARSNSETVTSAGSRCTLPRG
jgi:pimeloyl-ACP methyl ester carboxylesterase